MHKVLTIMINALLTAAEQELELAKQSGNNQQDWIVHMTVSTVMSRLAGTYIEARKALT
jgi:hypothetical protein